MKFKLDKNNNVELQARIKELEEKLAADKERSIAGFGDAVVVEEYDMVDGKKEVIQRQVKNVKTGKTIQTIDTDFSSEAERTRQKEEETENYIKVMEQEGLKRADDYKRYYANYEKSLKNLEECILNVQLSTTQTSVNFALIRVWLEMEYLTTKFDILRNEIKYNTFYAFCCNVNFREWAKKIRMYSDHIISIYDNNQTDDELYLQPLGNIPHAYINPPNRNADEDTFGFLADSMKPYGRSTSYKDMYALKTLSDELLPALYKFREACDSKHLRRAIKGRMEKFSDDLDAIYLMISSPSLDNLSSVFYCFDTDDDEIGKEVEAFVEANKERASFVRLVGDKMKKLYDKHISKYCNEEEWHSLFDWSDNDCQPDYNRLGEYIFRLKDNDDRIAIAKDIVRLVNYWLHYNWAIMTYQEKLQEENKGKSLEDISPSGIPKELLVFLLIEDKDDLIKFANLIRNEASKLCDETGRKDFWDYFYFVCLHYKLVRVKPFKKKCSRVKFSKILSCILYGSDKEAEKLQYMMEKSGLQATMPQNAIRKTLRSDIGKLISELIEKQCFSHS